MRLGLDFYGTIQANSKFYRELAELVLAGGGSVFVVSAIKAGNEKRLVRELHRTRVPHTALEIILFDNWFDVPKLKLEVYKRLNLDCLIDDRADVCDMVPNGLWQPRS